MTSLSTFDNAPVKFFASASHDSRIKVWDALSGVLLNEYSEEQHLAAQYTCISFVRTTVKVFVLYSFRPKHPHTILKAPQKCKSMRLFAALLSNIPPFVFHSLCPAKTDADTRELYRSWDGQGHGYCVATRHRCSCESPWKGQWSQRAQGCCQRCGV